ncbi:hypothetical protein JCM19232_235 [Vibrio ishigakensis]|uniref:Uncharacterized protein n=1 Tax=Vibrio ishigakensis TaxID=1481914 RepID=A0A0B8P5W7_9VIBR|nr:hypothetical protein JCM19232_235 [Vibrio ishigakensis]
MPVKLDLAYALDEPAKDEFRIHFSIGTQFYHIGAQFVATYILY